METAMRITITTTAADLAKAYFDGRLTGTVLVSACGLSSKGRPISHIRITRGSRRVTLSGRLDNTIRSPWYEVYLPTAVRIDD